MSLLDECFPLAGWVPPARSPSGDELVWSEPRGEAAWFVLGPLGVARARARELARWRAETLKHWRSRARVGSYSGPLESRVRDSRRLQGCGLCHGAGLVLDGGLMMNVGQGA